MKKYDIAVIGAGPSGSASGMLLCKAGYSVALIEKKSFPREVLCGEFISHEATGFLTANNLFYDFLALNPNTIKNFTLFNANNSPIRSSLGFKGYGLRRSKFDNLLFNGAAREGAVIYQPAEALEIIENKPGYIIKLSFSDGSPADIFSRIVICAYGKQNVLDKKLNRKFHHIKSGLNGIKYHIPLSMTEHLNPEDIQIYTAANIYCGINKIDNDTVTLCYLEKREENISPKEKLLWLYNNNLHFRELIPDPYSIIKQTALYGTGNIYFGKKDLVTDGVFFTGDSAMVIAPLAGDGISMALESAEIASSIITQLLSNKIDIHTASALYKKKFTSRFNLKLKTASAAQTILLNNLLRTIGIKVVNQVPSLLSTIIRYTRSQTSFHHW